MRVDDASNWVEKPLNLNGIQDVSGSIPLVSTRNPETIMFQVFYFE
jgi:hypothetical protein